MNRPLSLATILTLSLGFVLVQLDVSIVNVAVARIGEGLRTDMAGLQWIVDAYSVAFAALLMSGGALCDRFGARQVFVAGFLVFALASAACGVAPGLASLIVARTVQGMAAAMLVPGSLSLLAQACDDERERARAVGIWTAAGALAVAAGPVVGGVLVDTVGWRWIFLVNVPIAAAAIALARRHVPRVAHPKTGPRLDVTGVVLAAVTLFALTAAIIEGPVLGLHHPVLRAAIALAVVGAVAFVTIEARRADTAMLPLHLFRRPSFSAALTVGLAINLTIYGFLFVMALYFQRAALLSPLWTGLAFLPVAALVGGTNLLAGRLSARFGVRLPMLMGLIGAAVGYTLLIGIGARTPYTEMLVGLCLISGGTGLAVPAMTSAVLASVERQRAGIASGVLNTVRQAGGATGVALFGALTHGDVDALIGGLHVVFAIAAALLAVAAGVAALALAGSGDKRGREGTKVS